MELSRRSFVFSVAALAAAPPARLLGKSFLRVSQEPPAPLTAVEKELLGQLCEQIIPPDDFPGARELGVVDFIDRLLKEAHPGWIEVYRSGLIATQASCRRLHGQIFDQIETGQRTSLLRKMEQGELVSEDWQALSQDQFFEMLRSHTMNGYYSHPRWGGNRGKKSWKMIGYDDFWA